MRVGTERGFDERGEDGWGEGGRGHSFVHDPSAPVDPPTVLEMRFPACGRCGGNSLGNRVVGPDMSDGDPQELYVRFVFRYSPNWTGNPSGVNKLLYLAQRGDRASPVYLAGFGRGSSPLVPQLRQQGQDSRPCGHNRTRNIHQNAGRGEFRRGEWHTVELLLRLNSFSPGRETCDGTAKMWLDGRLVLDVRDVHWLDQRVGRANWSWWRVNMDPVWGGGQGTIPSDQWIRVAHLRAAVR